MEKFKHVTEEVVNEIKRLYHDEDLTVKQVAERMEMPVTRINNIIKYHRLNKKTYKPRVDHSLERLAELAKEKEKEEHLIFAKNEKQAKKVQYGGKKYVDLTDFYV